MDGVTTERPIVRVSPATRRDVPALAYAYLRAFEDSPQNPVFAPQYVGVFGEDLIRKGLDVEINRLNQRLVERNISMKASVVTTNERGETVEKVVGFASWLPPEGPRTRTLWKWFLANVYYRIRNYFIPLDMPENLGPFISMMEEQKAEVFGKGAPWEGRKYWYLFLLFVDPDWQRRGVGGALMDWAFEKARQSGTVVYVESSPMGLPAYKGKGFKIVTNLPREMCGVVLEGPGLIWEP
ncbi:hypothetical protein Clacol_000809 [Clathrus columnatus]|uniref:N-acetyltransferase domain-containing protein n=1 Tax=Clathrus columnatus TaxID=1419009 RepID=A0AAV4ZX63_9AGAM|nr:hypothetical protein Clacol_000809 [Clathrus columnatus]